MGEVLAALDRPEVGRQHAGRLLQRQRRSAGPQPRIDRAEVRGHRINGPLRGRKPRSTRGGIAFRSSSAGQVRSSLERCRPLWSPTPTCLPRWPRSARPRLPHAAGEDSYSCFRTARQGHRPAQRKSLVTDSVLGLFAIQDGAWKLIRGQGGGGHSPTVPPSQPTSGPRGTSRPTLQSGRRPRRDQRLVPGAAGNRRRPDGRTGTNPTARPQPAMKPWIVPPDFAIGQGFLQSRRFTPEVAPIRG